MVTSVCVPVCIIFVCAYIYIGMNVLSVPSVLLCVCLCVCARARQSARGVVRESDADSGVTLGLPVFLLSMKGMT